MAFAHGKVILLGEHAVVYGRPALAAALDRGVRSTAQPSETDTLILRPWNRTVAPSTEGDDLERAFAESLTLFRPERPSLRVECDVDLPAGAGLGCSAAIGVAVIGAIDEALGTFRSDEERAEASIGWERVFHGNPSGIDSAMAACGGVAVFRRGKPREVARLREPLHLVIGHSGESASTKAMVAQVARQHERDPSRVDKVFDAMASIVQNGRLALEVADGFGFGKLMDLNQGLLSSLMLSTSRIEDLCAAARDAGAFGAKLTGSGGGGCVIALAAPACIEAVHKAFEALGCSAWTAEIK